jgi:hypothetical protein
MMDISKVQFLLKGPYRHGDGSFKFDVILTLPSLVPGEISQIVGTAAVHVDTDKCCDAMGRALIQVATQLPPQLERVS